MTSAAPCKQSICRALAEEASKIARFKIDAAASEAAYADLNDRVPPDGFRNAKDADLARLGLSRDFIDHPIDPKTGKPSNFRAVVFINDATQEKLIAFKGTTWYSPEDWANNARQGVGADSFYYTRAQAIATKAASSPGGSGVRFTGHSLGGGMASAAARVTGKPATTFNAAGLHPDTIKMCTVPGQPIDAVYVRGEVLTSVQQMGLPEAASSRSWPLDPPAGYGGMMLAAGALIGPGSLGTAILARSIGLHLMGAVDRSMEQRAAEIPVEMERNGCR